MNGNRIQRASLLYFVATLFNKGIAFLTVPIFTRLLSTSDYGIVTTYSSWVDILTVVLSLALYMAIRIAFVDYKEEKAAFLNTVITFTLCLSIGVGVLSLLIGRVINGLGSVIIIMAVIQGTASALLMDYQQYLMMDFRYVKRSLYMALPNFLAVLFSILVIYCMHFDKVYLGRIIPTAIVYFGFGAVIVVTVYRKSRPSINKEYLKYGLAISLPLVFHGIALNILSLSDRTMITVLADASQTGIYSLVYNFSMIAAVLTTALDGAWLPWFMNKVTAGEIQIINKCASDYIKVMTYAMVALILVGPEILKLLVDKTYWEGISIIPPIVLANYFIFAYTFYVNVEHIHKKTAGITINTLIAAAINIILNFVFIPKYGYVAAAYTTLVSYIAATVLHAYCSRKLEKDLFPAKIFGFPLVLILVSFILYYVLLDKWIFRWSIMILILSTAAFKERQTIASFIKKGERNENE